MDYRIIHENLIEDGSLQTQFREKLDGYARKIDTLPERYRKDGIWCVRLFRYGPDGFRIQIEMDWQLKEVVTAREGHDLLRLTDSAWEAFWKLLVEQVKHKGTSNRDIEH